MPKRKRDNEKEGKKTKTKLSRKDGIKEPGANDVINGRGDTINRHPGNVQFRKMVDKRRRVYLTSHFKREKRLIAETIVASIRALEPPGRFLFKDEKSGLWFEMDDDRAREKTSQALRENSKKFKQEIENEILKKRSVSVTPSEEQLPPPCPHHHHHHHHPAHHPASYPPAWGYPASYPYAGYAHGHPPMPPPMEAAYPPPPPSACNGASHGYHGPPATPYFGHQQQSQQPMHYTAMNLEAERQHEPSKQEQQQHYHHPSCRHNTSKVHGPPPVVVPLSGNNNYDQQHQLNVDPNTLRAYSEALNKGYSNSNGDDGMAQQQQSPPQPCVPRNVSLSPDTENQTGHSHNGQQQQVQGVFYLYPYSPSLPTNNGTTQPPAASRNAQQQQQPQQPLQQTKTVGLQPCLKRSTANTKRPSPLECDQVQQALPQAPGTPKFPTPRSSHQTYNDMFLQNHTGEIMLLHSPANEPISPQNRMRRFMDQTAVYGNNNCGSEQPFEAFHTSNDGSNNTNDHHDASGRGDDISPVEQFPFSPNMMSALMNGAGVMGMSPGARLKPRRQSYV